MSYNNISFIIFYIYYSGSCYELYTALPDFFLVKQDFCAKNGKNILNYEGFIYIVIWVLNKSFNELSLYFLVIKKIPVGSVK